MKRCGTFSAITAYGPPRPTTSPSITSPTTTTRWHPGSPHAKPSHTRLRPPGHRRRPAAGHRPLTASSLAHSPPADVVHRCRCPLHIHIQRIHGAPDVLEVEPQDVGIGEARGVHLDHPAGNGHKGRSVVDERLHHDDVLCGRLDALALQHMQVKGCVT